jgi:eukaryotic-like serine/threonine-protein kinase
MLTACIKQVLIEVIKECVMWFPFFKDDKKSEFAGDIIDMHNESTQTIHSKPGLDDLEEGYIYCTSCGEPIYIYDFPELALQPCGDCGCPNFIPLKVKNYWLFAPLGGGGMGSVYHAYYDQDEDVDLAVKILPRERKNDPYLTSSLLNEAQIGYSFGEHPHLNRVIDYGQSDDEYFAVFEYISGIRLDQIIESPVKRSEKQILLWALQLLAAEQQIFDCGYLFRDLKPQNIIIDGEGNVKLFDYGLAISIEDALGDGGDKIEGSPYYIPPERIVGSGEAQCSEIYSLGMVLFHTLAGKTYYSSDEIKNLVGKHVTSLRITNVSSKLPSQTDPEISTILSKMILRSPQERYQTYKEVAAELFKVYKELAA